MKQRLFLTAAIALPLFLGACKGNSRVDVTVANPARETIGARTIELPAQDMMKKLGAPGFYVADSEGNEIPSQLTYDGKIIFTADVAPGESKKFTLFPSDSVRSYTATVAGDFYPKRRDDVAFENELVGFRLYGPGTQRAGERSYGYDLFLKHPTDELIVPELYALETDDATWARVDSLRRIDPKLADEYVDSFSYHIDHGKGMDCYAVGSTLGAGVAAILVNDSIAFPWCYETAQILDNGPLRFTLAMTFPPKTIGSAENVVEKRLLSLDSRQHLNTAKVWYEGLDGEKIIVTGFPLRDDSEVIQDKEKGIITYADPTQGPDNGKAMVGVVLGAAPDSIIFREGHALLSRKLAPADTLSYKWGFAWDRTDITTLPEWKDYLDKSSLNYTVTY